MSDGSRARVRSFGTLDREVGGILWTLGGVSSGLSLRGAEVLRGEPDPSGSRWDFEDVFESDPTAGAGVFRHIAIEVSGRGTLICSSRSEAGAQDHAAEDASSRLQGESEQLRFEETLISTQYDAVGRVSRFGLELWPGEADPANRAGATRTSATLIAGDWHGSSTLPAGSTTSGWIGFYRCHTDGAEGLGTYLLWRT